MLASIIAIHGFIAWLILIVGGVTFLGGGVWLLMRRGGEMTAADPLRRTFRYGLVATTALGALQTLLGVIMVLLGRQPGNVLHYVYGVLVLLLLPLAWVYSDQDRVRRDTIIMVVAALLVVAAGGRAFMTGMPH